MTSREFRALFAAEFWAESWRAWNAIEDAVFGDVRPEDAALVRSLTRRTSLPTAPVAELWCVVGRGGGKSRFVARLAAFFACGRQYRVVAGENVFVGVFAPDRKQAKLTFGYVVGLLRSVPALAALITRETSDSVELSTGVVIEVITATASAPRGRAYALVIVEEAAFLDADEHSAEPDRELLRAVRPALARVPGSVLAVVSSPYWMRGELYRTWHDRFGKDDPDVLVVQADTLTMNPAFSRREVERAQREDPIAAAAEYFASFRTDVTDFITAESLAACVMAGVRECAPERGREPIAHFDGATGSGEDDAALALAWADDDGRAVLGLVRRWEPPFSPVSVVQEAAALLAQYGVDSVEGDRFAPNLFGDLFAAKSIAYTVAERDTSGNFIELLALVNSGRVALLDDDVLLQQLRGLERRTRSGGRDSVGHRSRAHDDVAAAAAGALVSVAREAAAPPLALLDPSRDDADADDAVDVDDDVDELLDPSAPTSALTRMSEAMSGWWAQRQQARALACREQRRARADGREQRRRELERCEQQLAEEAAERAAAARRLEGVRLIERACTRSGAWFPGEF